MRPMLVFQKISKLLPATLLLPFSNLPDPTFNQSIHLAAGAWPLADRLHFPQKRLQPLLLDALAPVFTLIMVSRLRPRRRAMANLLKPCSYNSHGSTISDVFFISIVCSPRKLSDSYGELCDTLFMTLNCCKKCLTCVCLCRRSRNRKRRRRNL